MKHFKMRWSAPTYEPLEAVESSASINDPNRSFTSEQLIRINNLSVGEIVDFKDLQVLRLPDNYFAENVIKLREVEKYVRLLRNATCHVNELWQECMHEYEDVEQILTQNYPFKQSFDELYLEIANWSDSIKEYLDASIESDFSVTSIIDIQERVQKFITDNYFKEATLDEISAEPNKLIFYFDVNNGSTPTVPVSYDREKDMIEVLLGFPKDCIKW